MELKIDRDCMYSIGAVIVTYNPDYKLLLSCIKSLENKVAKIVVVDNSNSRTDNLSCQFNSVIYYHNGGNKGIAHAQNQGIKILMEYDEIEYILFSDQDSIFKEDCIDYLFQSMQILLNFNKSVASVGTFPIDNNGNALDNRSDILDKISFEYNNKKYNIIEVNWHLSSGSLISKSVLKKVGHMEEDLFIDGVDNEWSWRAKGVYNLSTYVACGAKMIHTYGEDNDGNKIFKYYHLPSFRLYYYFRNSIIIMRRSYCNKKWRKYTLLVFPIKLLFFSLICPPRWKNFQNIIKGIKDSFKYKNSNIINI